MKKFLVLLFLTTSASARDFTFAWDDSKNTEPVKYEFRIKKFDGVWSNTITQKRQLTKSIDIFPGDKLYVEVRAIESSCVDTSNCRASDWITFSNVLINTPVVYPGTPSLIGVSLKGTD